VWLNVLPADRWDAVTGRASWDPDRIFPWTVAPRAGAVVTPDGAHPLTVYWAMPRRNRLVVDGDRVVGLQRAPGGPDYQGWRYPLTPYQTTKDGLQVARRLPTGHVGYTDWAGIATLGQHDSSPAIVVNEFIERRWKGEALRLRVGGWATLGNELATWNESTVPLLVQADPVVVEALLDTVQQRAAALSRAAKKAKIVVPTSLLYERTETSFYQRVRSGDIAGWAEDVRRVAIDLYDEYSERQEVEPLRLADARRAVLARHDRRDAQAG
jgi:CRISPR type I-E-associated protein CasA/Cse1